MPSYGRGDLYGRGVNMNPRDFKKAAPVLGVLLVVAVALYAITRLLL